MQKPGHFDPAFCMREICAFITFATPGYANLPVFDRAGFLLRVVLM